MKGLGYWALAISMTMLCGCNRPSKAELYRAEKHQRDSIALQEQLRSLDYYQAVHDSLLPQADSLIRFFKYERNEKYQDHGYYVTTAKWGNVRIMVRDDGAEVLVYENGKRKSEWTNGQMDESLLSKVSDRDKEAYLRAKELHLRIRDIRELEKRIARTSLEVQKLQRRTEQTSTGGK